MSKKIKTTGKSLATAPVAESLNKPSSDIIPNKSTTCKVMRPLKTTKSGLMKLKNNDVVTSDEVAKHLGVRHFDLLKSIKKAEKYQNAMNDKHRSLKIDFHPTFKDFEYVDTRGRAQKCKLMNLDGLYALIKIVDTQKAFNYYAVIISEHKNLNLERMNRADSKVYMKALTDNLQELYFRLHEAGSSQLETNLYTNYNKKVCIALNGKYEKGKLDALEADGCADLTEIRIGSLNLLDKWLETIDDPKEIRKKLWVYIEEFSTKYKAA